MLAITGGTVLTPQTELAGGVVLIEAGKILKVGQDLPVPAEAQVIDARGKFVLPGFIDAHCHTGVFADGVGWEKGDGNEMTDPVTPHLRAVDAIHPEDMAFEDLRRAGVTTVNTGPGSANLVGGTAAVVKTCGRTVEEMLVLSPAGMKMALGENPKRVYGEQKKTPSTRMGNAGLLREWLVKAQNYLDRWERHRNQPAEPREQQGRTREPPERDLRLEALSRVLTGEIPVHMHVHRADDILTALRVADEFGLRRLVLIHATEGYKVADALAERGVPCVVGPIHFSRTKYELRGMNPQNPAILSRAGVKVAIQTDEMSAVRYILFDAALAVREGMDEGEALKAITLYPAEILGIADRVGSLAPGKDADLVVLSAHPFQLTKSKVELVVAGGRVIHRATGG
ncbi:MAG: amidohydrolase [Candidatus Bipolaricaulaceae bacterium]